MLVAVLDARLDDRDELQVVGAERHEDEVGLGGVVLGVQIRLGGPVAELRGAQGRAATGLRGRDAVRELRAGARELVERRAEVPGDGVAVSGG